MGERHGGGGMGRVRTFLHSVWGRRGEPHLAECHMDMPLALAAQRLGQSKHSMTVCAQMPLVALTEYVEAPPKE